MPAPKPLHETVAEDLPENNGGSYQDHDMEDDDDSVLHLQNEDSDRSPSSEGLQNVEFLLVQLSDMRNEVQCPICLGIIRKTRTVMECLHRFCRDCIDKSMRMGNKECPSCRTHCASRRSLRDDPNYDALIAALYPNIDQYEEEELTFHDDEDARNKQIQAAIAQTLQRQSEALTKKRKRSQTTKRRRTSYHSDDNDYANDNSLSADERQETRPKRSRRSKGQQSPEASAGGGHNENDSELNRDTVAAVGGFVGSSEMLAWGRGGIRSQTRYGSAGGGNVKHSHDRISRLAEHLRNLDESHEMGIQILLVSLDVEKAPIQQPYLCCRPTLSVRQISECIAFQTSSQADEIELLAVNALHSKINSLMSLDVQPSDSSLLDACKDDLQPLSSDQTLQEVKSTFNLRQGHLILAYRQKSADPISCDEALQAMEVVSTQSIV